MPMVLETGEAGNKLTLEGVIDIAAAAELKRLLLDARGTEKPTVIAVGGVSDLDVTAMQLLWAATRPARGIEFRPAIAGDIPTAVSTLLSDAGMKELLQGISQAG